MSKSRVTPTDTAREFRLEEAFFSWTDRKGTILGGNRVFQRVSGYSEAELIGHPHNTIRHPDMPRAVFRLFWSRILEGKPCAAYVKNMAKDGSYYWVLALVSPHEDGFISIRFSPTGPFFPIIEKVYQKMRAAERAGDGRAIDVSSALLDGALKELGYDDYESFMFDLVLQELDAREKALCAAKGSIYSAAPQTGRNENRLHATLRQAYQRGCTSADRLESLYKQVYELSALNDLLQDSTKQLGIIAEDFHIVAFNIALKADKLGDEGRSINTIANHLTPLSKETRDLVKRLASNVSRARGDLNLAIFNLTWTRLQFLMIVNYYHEVLDDVCSATEIPAIEPKLRLMRLLAKAFQNSGSHAVRDLETLARSLASINQHAVELGRLITDLLATRVNGLIEVSQLTKDQNFVDIFEDVRNQMTATEEGFKSLVDYADQLLRHASNAPRLALFLRDFSLHLEEEEQRVRMAIDGVQTNG